MIKPFDLQVLTRLKNEGKTHDDICVYFGIKVRTLEAWLRRHIIKKTSYYPNESYKKYYYKHYPKQRPETEVIEE